jgi:DSF synthase
MGVVDVLAEKGEGETVVYEYIKSHRRKMNAVQSMIKVRQHCYPISYKELINVADIWVDAALRLDQKNLRLMERLVRAQDRLSEESAVSENFGGGYA